MASTERPCSLLVFDYKPAELVKPDELRAQLQKGPVDQKIAALKKMVVLMANGEKLGGLVMPVIQYAMPEQNHMLKKLLFLYWEMVEKLDPQTGKLRPEMILACNSFLVNLKHPSEYVRGCTLRLLCKVKEVEILEPLVAAVCENLEHRHAYVRRNAVWALHTIHRNFPHLVPNSPDLVYSFLQSESDASCKRNALLMLYHCDQEKAVAYINSVLDQVASFGEILQFAIVEILFKLCKATPALRAQYLNCVVSLLGSSSPAVRFEAAGTLLAISAAPSSVKKAAVTYIDILCSESDNNVKLVALERVRDIKTRVIGGTAILQEVVMDVMRALACPTLEIRSKALDIALDLVTARNVEQVVAALKKELVSSSQPGDADYRQVIVQAINSCAVRFPEVAGTVVHVLMDFLGDAAAAGASDVVSFVREAAETHPNLRKQILTKLVEALPAVRSARVYRAALWVVGEYARDADEVVIAFNVIKDALKEIPAILAAKEEDEKRLAAEAQTTPSAPASSSGSGVRVLADGTYATQAVVPSSTPAGATTTQECTLKSLLLEGDYLLSGIVAYTLAKLALKAASFDSLDATAKNRFCAEVLLQLAHLLRLGTSKVVTRQIDQDSRERIVFCINIVAQPPGSAKGVPRDVLLNEGCKAFAKILAEKAEARKEGPSRHKDVDVQADDLIKIRQLSRASTTTDAVAVDDESDVAALAKLDSADENMGSKLNRVVQLTGYSDPLYAEAFVYVHQYDIVLDVLVTNQMPTTVQNVSFEVATLGDLKLVERPQAATISPGATARVKATLKVASTETGVIFGNLTYEPSGSAAITQNAPDRNCVVLNEVRIDIMDYIFPATCNDVKFRQMWAEFEWENRLPVTSPMTDTVAFAQLVAKTTNMAFMTPLASLSSDTAFLSANLYARSVFGEDALANISLEFDGKQITGFVRIRSNTQGIAFALGDKINQKLRS